MLNGRNGKHADIPFFVMVFTSLRLTFNFRLKFVRQGVT